MSAALGSLVVSLEANMAKFQSEMTKSAYVTEQAMLKIQQSSSAAKSAIMGIAAGAIGSISASMFVDMVKGAIDAADHLNDLSKMTGISVESLGGLGFAAGQAGGDLESIAAAAGKMNKSLAEAASGNKEFGAAFDALSINIKSASGDLKKADVVIAEVADKFARYEDGPEKSAIALRLFGKAGADVIPLLNDGGDALRENIEYYQKYSGVTQEVADKSDAFNDSLGKLHLLQGVFGRELAANLLGPMQGMLNYLVESKEKSDLAVIAADRLAESLKEVAKGAVYGGSGILQFTEWVGASAAAWGFLLKGDSAGARAVREDYEGNIKAIEDGREKMLAAIASNPVATALPAAGSDDPPKKKLTLPILPGSQMNGQTDDPAKKQYEGHLKLIEATIAKEQSELDFGNKYIAALREQDKISLESYNDYRQKSIESGLAIVVSGYDKEIAEAERYQATAEKRTEKAGAQNKIDELRAKKSKAIQDAENESRLLTLDLSKSQSELNKAMEDWNRSQTQSADQLQFSNDLIGKSTLEIERLTNARRIELDIEEKIRVAKEKGVITEESIAQYRKDAAAQAGVVNRIATQTVGKNIVREQRKPEEVEDELHANRIKDLQAYKDAEFIAIEDGNKAIEEEVRRHEAAKMEMEISRQKQSLEAFGSTADMLYGMMQQAGKDQTALAKAAFLASKAIAVADIIMNTEVAAAKAGAQLGIFGIPMSTMIRVTGYAQAGMVAGMAIAGAREKGGPVWGGGAFLVGEKGPEIFKPTGHGTIIPNDKIGSGSSGEMKLTIVNNTSAKIGNVVEKRISDTERALIIQEAVAATSAQFDDPNSRTSKALSRNFSTQRTR